MQRGQGTIEYLVIIAIVVVISLAVVSLLLSQTNDTTKITVSSNKIDNLIGTGGISIVDSVTSSNGESIISLKNNSGSAVTIQKITPITSAGELGEDTNCYTQLEYGSTFNCVLYDLNTSCPCTSGQDVVCKYKLSYLGQGGIEKTTEFELKNTCSSAIQIESFSLVYAAGTGGTLESDGATNTTIVQTIKKNKSGKSVEAIPSTGYKFVKWSDNKTTNPRRDLSIIDDLDVRAIFEEDEEEEPEQPEEPQVENNHFIFLIGTTEIDQNFSFRIDGAIDLNIIWGDGTSNLYNGTDLRSHVYSTVGDYNVLIKGKATRIAFGDEENLTTPNLLKDIYTPISNGVTGIISAENMFMDTSVVSFTAADFFDETSKNTTSMRQMFFRASFNQSIENWDTSKVTDMEWVFAGSDFNQNISDWNTQNVILMGHMFSNSPFDQPIGNWNTQNVTNMTGLFYACGFNQDISDWNTTKVTDMTQMFYGASFNQPIGNWNTQNVTNMSLMFSYGSNFNQDISDWNIVNVTTMYSMFKSNTKFNQNLSDWNVSPGTDHTYFDYQATAWTNPAWKPDFED